MIRIFMSSDNGVIREIDAALKRYCLAQGGRNSICFNKF